MNENFDAARLTLLLSELRLPATKQIWASFAEQSDKEGWPAARLLTVIAENELAERDRRRIERHLAEAKLLPGKTLDNFELAPEKWTPRGLLFLTLWRIYESRTRSAVYG
jgi:DNA replication protein DnaC